MYELVWKSFSFSKCFCRLRCFLSPPRRGRSAPFEGWQRPYIYIYIYMYVCIYIYIYIYVYIHARSPFARRGGGGGKQRYPLLFGVFFRAQDFRVRVSSFRFEGSTVWPNGKGYASARTPAAHRGPAGSFASATSAAAKETIPAVAIQRPRRRHAAEDAVVPPPGFPAPMQDYDDYNNLMFENSDARPPPPVALRRDVVEARVGLCSMIINNHAITIFDYTISYQIISNHIISYYIMLCYVMLSYSI